VLSFDWSTAALTVDFDEPLPDAYTPHPEDTPERKRIGGVLRNYEPGGCNGASSFSIIINNSTRTKDIHITQKRIEGVLHNIMLRCALIFCCFSSTASWVATPTGANAVLEVSISTTHQALKIHSAYAIRCRPAVTCRHPLVAVCAT
jgi:hypothetical protein